MTGRDFKYAAICAACSFVAYLAFAYFVNLSYGPSEEEIEHEPILSTD